MPPPPFARKNGSKSADHRKLTPEVHLHFVPRAGKMGRISKPADGCNTTIIDKQCHIRTFSRTKHHVRTIDNVKLSPRDPVMFKPLVNTLRVETSRAVA